MAGANGISGQHFVRALSQTPRCQSVGVKSTLSPDVHLLKRPPLDQRTKHVPVDFLTSPEEIVEMLKENILHAFVWSSREKLRVA